jgi:hypothetical protein
MKKIFAWAPNEVEDLTWVPMFGKSLPFDNDTSSSGKKVMFCQKKGYVPKEYE